MEWKSQVCFNPGKYRFSEKVQQNNENLSTTMFKEEFCYKINQKNWEYVERKQDLFSFVKNTK
jgi:hypothetical protein